MIDADVRKLSESLQLWNADLDRYNVQEYIRCFFNIIAFRFSADGIIQGRKTNGQAIYERFEGQPLRHHERG